MTDRISPNPPEKYGNRKVSKMYAQINDLRRTIRSEGTAAIQDAWDKVEEHIDFAYRALSWRGIDSAPRDGQSILCSHPNFYGNCVILGWHFGGWRDRPDPNDAQYHPTHWTPLPVPPKDGE